MPCDQEYKCNSQGFYPHTHSRIHWCSFRNISSKTCGDATESLAEVVYAVYLICSEDFFWNNTKYISKSTYFLHVFYKVCDVATWFYQEIENGETCECSMYYELCAKCDSWWNSFIVIKKSIDFVLPTNGSRIFWFILSLFLFKWCVILLSIAIFYTCVELFDWNSTIFELKRISFQVVSHHRK